MSDWITEALKLKVKLIKEAPGPAATERALLDSDDGELFVVKIAVQVEKEVVVFAEIEEVFTELRKRLGFQPKEVEMNAYFFKGDKITRLKNSQDLVEAIKDSKKSLKLFVHTTLAFSPSVSPPSLPTKAPVIPTELEAKSDLVSGIGTSAGTAAPSVVVSPSPVQSETKELPTKTTTDLESKVPLMYSRSATDLSKAPSVEGKSSSERTTSKTVLALQKKLRETEEQLFVSMQYAKRFSSEKDTLVSEINSLKVERDVLTKQLEDLSRVLLETSTHAAKDSGKSSYLETENADLRNKLAALESKLSSISASKAVVGEESDVRAKKLEAEIADLEQKFEKTLNEKESLEKKLNSVMIQQAELVASLTAEKKINSALESRVAELSKSKAAAEADLSSLRTSMMEAKSGKEMKEQLAELMSESTKQLQKLIQAELEKKTAALMESFVKVSATVSESATRAEHSSKTVLDEFSKKLDTGLELQSKRISGLADNISSVKDSILEEQSTIAKELTEMKASFLDLRGSFIPSKIESAPFSTAASGKDVHGPSFDESEDAEPEYDSGADFVNIEPSVDDLRRSVVDVKKTYSKELESLVKLGYTNTKVNEFLMGIHEGNMEKILNELKTLKETVSPFS